MKAGARIHITGVVQGVGFRPFVYNLARQYALTGWVKNTSAGVQIQVDGSSPALQAFSIDLQNQTPPLARLDSFSFEPCPPDGFIDFVIIESENIPGAFQPVSPDVCTCPDCLSELFDPADRRYHYPFTNCTNCGPRFTIITDIPYDRPFTTMAGFQLCPDCATEYRNPIDRRFHAQPVACPVCGPQVWLEQRGNPERLAAGETALAQAQVLLKQGQILAIKGLGGFHLACDALNPQAVASLRERKLRVDKPFALMMADIQTVQKHCLLQPAERALLESPARPVVILSRRPASPVVESVAPGQKTIGVMLPYTPLHFLLFSPDFSKEPCQVIVMTSGNLSEEPIVTTNDDARLRLENLADAFLMHDRPIQTRCDDSVMRIFSETQEAYPIRRSRGYAPFPVKLPWQSPPIFAAGAELKNTFCITNGDYAFLSHHIGDMENFETLQSFEQSAAHYERLFRVKPVGLAYDLHPNYLATRYTLARAESQSLPGLGIQHHHAHIASVMAEHGLTPADQVIGVAFDGTGYGPDGAIWGGEFMLTSYSGYQRLAHLSYAPLPGGDMAIRKPARYALALLWQAGLEWDTQLSSIQTLCPDERHALRNQLEHRLNTPYTSSVGRLFDAVAALANVRQQINYEAQAAIELEALIEPNETGAYPFDIDPVQRDVAAQIPMVYQIGLHSMLNSLLSDVYANCSASLISARFHNGLANLVEQLCTLIRHDHNLNTVALSGGVWQNMYLLNQVFRRLKNSGFQVLTHRLVPANDGGVALGQAVIASHYFNNLA